MENQDCRKMNKLPAMPVLKIIFIPQGNESKLYFRKFNGVVDGKVQSEWTNYRELAMKTSEPDFWLGKLSLTEVWYGVEIYAPEET